MSHQTKVNVEIKNKASLIKALQEQGYTVQDKDNVVIAQGQGLYTDMKFKQDESGDFSQVSMDSMDRAKLRAVKQGYTVNEIESLLWSMNYNPQGGRVKLPDGSIKLTINM